MTRARILLAMFGMIGLMIQGYGQDILMTIGDREITLDEFERIYKKNNKSISDNQQTPEEYLDLFINFKLKVIEAENRGMDTTKKFLDEFNSYKDQLAKPYMTDESTKEILMREAYERMKYDINVSHILLGLPSQASPEDTLKRYNMAMEIRQRILDGEDFETVARATSEDPSVRMNGGNLGYFTAFMMVYPFETAAYNMEVGEVSMPVRTMHGYHIIKKHDQRPAIGKVKIAHIYLRIAPDFSEEQREEVKDLAMAIGDSIKMGVDFAQLVKHHTDDRQNAHRGGELPWTGVGRWFKYFEDAAFGIEKPGEYTEPFQSDYGWHIIKLLDKQKIGTYEEMLTDLESKALKGDRDREKRKRYLDKLKEDYKFVLDETAYASFYNELDTSIFKARWEPSSELAASTDVLFSTTKGAVTKGTFARHLQSIQRNRGEIPIVNYMDITFNKYVEDHLLELEKASLPERFPEYRYILQEYHDGILLFELMDEMVWTKAVNDTTGLEAFFADHREDYMWGERMKALIVSCDSTADVAAVLKKSSKIGSGRWDAEKLNKKFCNDTLPCISLEEVIVEKGRNAHVDEMNGTLGTGKVFMENGKSKFVITTKIVKPTPKELNETRGQVTSDYQDYLEKIWIKQLKEKYSIDVNRDLLSKI
jgi:peptidyl-prolyl cis-trans isomerase SurA